MEYKVGDLITTNDRNCHKIIAVNADSYCTQDLLDKEFYIFTKTEHTYKAFIPFIVLTNCLKEILDDAEVSEDKIPGIINDMFLRYMAFL